MLHLALYGLLAIIVAAGLFLLATRFLPAGEQIAPPLRDEPPWDLPAERNLQAEDVDTVRLPVALRGYRFAETDVLLDRLAGELRTRDAEIARLRRHAEDAQYRSDKDPEQYAPPPDAEPQEGEPAPGPDDSARVVDERPAGEPPAAESAEESAVDQSVAAHPHDES